MSQIEAEGAAATIADSAHEASRATGAVTDAIEDGVGVVKHLAKQGCDAAEELLNDTAQRLQRHISLTLAVTFVVGAVTGALIGRTMKRR